MFENIQLAFQGVFGHKLRSFLTMLGIIIGIASIIPIISTIKGTNEQIISSVPAAISSMSSSIRMTGPSTCPIRRRTASASCRTSSAMR